MFSGRNLHLFLYLAYSNSSGNLRIRTSKLALMFCHEPQSGFFVDLSLTIQLSVLSPVSDEA